ncbi:MAG: lamin tail domain-containing protein, partial [Calditrichales bacterium]|nr:lamin tail domain-containing protein [Calditrichales bacterium]
FRFAAPDIGNISNTPVNVTPYSNVWINVEVNNANLVKLGYRRSILDKFEKAQMFDDGSHNDGAAGDGIYGVSIQTGAMGIQYYIYAENNDAAMFSPQRAEYEYYTLSVTGNLVINEFMAINDAAVPDQNGEYDDWVELYNNTNTAISLNGYYLSDDGSKLTRWAFPDTFIAANDYLIIWTDKDAGQIGLHTDFKLSGSGEAVILVDSSQAVVDEFIFGQQTADISSGRYPNGMGAFIAMSPTFSAENVNGITGIKRNPTPALSTFMLYQNYPNPFNPQTTISYQLPVNGDIALKIYDMLGREVRTLVNENKTAGYHSVVWNGIDNSGRQVSSGVYFYQLKIDNNFSEIEAKRKPRFFGTNKMLLIK